MKKILLIGWKDLIIIFQDRGALILMLAAPFLLTLALGFVTGAFTDNESGTGLSAIPVVIVNQDAGALGQALVDSFTDPELNDLVAPQVETDEAGARRQVAADEIAAAVIIPAGFSDSLMRGSKDEDEAGVTVEVVANPTRPISAEVISSIVEQFVYQAQTVAIGTEVIVTQLVRSGRAAPDPDELAHLSADVSAAQVTAMQTASPPLTMVEETAGAANVRFNPLAYFAPGMAVAFLMYTVALGGRSFLQERDQGTLSRLLATPSEATQIIGGKVAGIFFTGAAQVTILIVASILFFQLRWGNPVAVGLLIVAVAAAATGWGLLLAVLARDASQVSSFGTALMLTFAIMGGSFAQLGNDGFLNTASKITPNAWAIDAFTALYQGASLVDILPQLGALLLMASLLFALAVLLFRRRRETILG